MQMFQHCSLSKKTDLQNVHTSAEVLPSSVKNSLSILAILLKAQNKQIDPFLAFVTAISFKKLNAHIRAKS